MIRACLLSTWRGPGAALWAGLVLAGGALWGGPALADCSLASPVTWTAGASGPWTNGANWSGGVYPNSAGTNVCVTDGRSTVSLDSDATVGDLQTGPGTGITIDPGGHLTVAGTQFISTGALNIDAGFGKNAVFSIGNDVTVSGHILPTGVQPTSITLSSGPGAGTAYIRGAGHTLTSYDMQIQGAGVIGDDGMNFVNGIPGDLGSFGVILANTPGGVLDINSGGGSFVSGGYVNVSAGSTLKVTGDSKGFDQIGGYTVVDGNLIVPHGFDNEATTMGRQNGQGFLGGSGTVTGDVSNAGIMSLGTIIGNVYNDGDLGPQSPLSVSGDFTQGQAGSLDLGLGSTADIGGEANLGGALNLAQEFPAGGLYRIMDFAGSSGNFSSLSLGGSACNSEGDDLWACAEGYHILEKFDGGGLDLQITGVPEPASWTILLVGIASLGAMIRARQERSAA